MKFAVLIIAVILVSGFVFRMDISHLLEGGNPTMSVTKEKKTKDKSASEASAEISVKEKFDLPEILKEVSGIAYIDGQRFACIQDEQGIIFIYNKASNKIEREIRFAGAGDYEDISLNGQTAWVVRADGVIYEVDMSSGKAFEYKTVLTVEHNVEGMHFDKKNNRLLLAMKNEDPGQPGFKNVRSFNLQSKQLESEHVFRIDLAHETLKDNTTGKKPKYVAPSAIAIHPLTNDYYITDGPKSRLLIADASGKPKFFYQLGKDFAQPEGITFTPDGTLYISNEGTKQPGNILRVEVKQ